MLAFVLITLVVQTQVAQLRAQTCSGRARQPQHVCTLCGARTLRIAAQIPAKCNLPPLSCGG
ncbi:hypothetical protein Acr_02g0001710 [Actinidia rufa]|uniref:Uncharacterized protein n=1 Tax=Actinidia rufa TaxID=165716 RepID=A0A7J0E5Z7_9ERIC|nr:hypothetical protein Acr_02g0001710 [Actinidia rufa]